MLFDNGWITDSEDIFLRQGLLYLLHNKLKFCPSNPMIADCMTKPLNRKGFLLCKREMGMLRWGSVENLASRRRIETPQQLPQPALLADVAKPGLGG